MNKCYKGFNKSSVELYSGVCDSNIDEIINEGVHKALQMLYVNKSDLFCKFITPPLTWALISTTVVHARFKCWSQRPESRWKAVCY